MIWHEMSQSASLGDWIRYPYMFVHVDISFQYLAALAAYVATSGDAQFARDHWPGLSAAWRYCTSLIDARSGLPQIPAGKQGQNEQDQLRDDIRLSTLWIEAADGFARLARFTGHEPKAATAAAMAERARQSLAEGGWDNARDFWLSGHTLSGEAVHDERPDASGVLTQNVFSAEKVDRVLDRLAAPEFATDWGIRSLSAAAPGYDPNLYGSGSVWALGTASVATTFWQSHRPLPAWSLWRALVSWNTLDSGGHLHEVLAGDLFHPELESVPEQTWSSASLLASAVQGLLGLAVRSGQRRIEFAPHLPAGWPGITLRNVMVGGTQLSLETIRDARGISLQIDNPGVDVAVVFAPEVQLGAVVGGASIDGAPISVQTERHAQDTHARASFIVHHGTTHAHIDLSGGVVIEVPTAPLLVGDRSSALKIVWAKLAGNVLSVAAWVTLPTQSSVIISTPWQPLSADGARVKPLGRGPYEVDFGSEGTEKILQRYGKLKTALITFDNEPASKSVD